MDYRLTYTRYPSVFEGYTDASWISNIEDNSSTSGWVFLLGGGVIAWAFKKQTCITSSTMKSEFVALATAGKEAECLKNLLFEIRLWYKPITSISIHCDSVATLAKAYSRMYNGKSRHLGVRHNMIRELIMNGVVSIEFVRSQRNFVDHLTKMCLELADKEDEVVNFLLINFFEKVRSRSMNKEEPPIRDYTRSGPPQHGDRWLAVVEFRKTRDGFDSEMTFVKDFELDKHGRKDFYDRGRGMELMQEKTTKQLENIFIEHEKRKRQLEDREKELRAREAVNDTEKRKLGSEKKKVLQCCVTSDIYAFKKI
ncbi:zinc finger, CCHC-type containing protein [Tanacetum coccineum]